ncbi:MAG TPA: phosphoribosylamine--glycine ligase [Gemmatimonadaceae bacterium]|nr:phosphoribosylamine--glycine ligase [Gemmatimonadaceae bacterium]
MKILIVGGGGREHALAWKLAADDPDAELLAAPGNPGIAALARCVSIAPTDLDALVRLARDERIDLTVVGPEAPLSAGIVDRFRDAGLAAFGPTRAAAEIESSKAFAKELMQSARVPTARAERHTQVEPARQAVRRMGAPVVVKASGLAAGKGVIVCESLAQADAAIDDMLRGGRFGHAGAELLVEEFMEGEELSLFVLTDGTTVLPMLPAQDHKRLLEGDAGPNTGGMGAYAPVSIGTPALVGEVVETIVRPTLAAMRERGRPFTGLLYAGLMLTADGPSVVEFNCRFGDPETEALLPLLESPLLPILGSIARGEPLAEQPLRWRDAAAVTTVVAAPGYPDVAQTGAPIALPPVGDDVVIFHAGTARDARGALVSAGGRVLAVTAVAPTLADAQARSAAVAAAVGMEGKQLRRDIGWRELQRHAGASRD